MSIAVLWNGEDARRFMVESPSVDAVLPLTPVACAAVLKTAVRILDPRSIFNDEAQERCGALVAEQRQKATAALAPIEGAVPALREVALDHFNRVAFSSLRLWESLGDQGPWVLYTNNGWQQFEERFAAYEAALHAGLGEKIAGEYAVAQITTPAFPGFFCWLQRSIFKSALRRSSNILTNAAKEQFGLLQILRNREPGARVIVVQPSEGLGRAYLKLLREMLRVWLGRPQVQFALVPRNIKAQDSLVEKIVGAVDDPIIGPAFLQYRGLMGYRFAMVRALEGEAAALVGCAPFHAFVSAESSDLVSWVMAIATGQANIPRLVLSRNAHAPFSDGAARDSVRGYFYARFPNNLVDGYLMWSPAGAAAARQVLPKANWSKIFPVRVSSPVPLSQMHAGVAERERKILIADSFVTWWYPHNWIYQNSGEFVAGLKTLCAAITEVDNVHATVRVKNKPECNLATLTQLVEPPANIDIDVRNKPFLEEAIQADLVVSFRSTTIEEALHTRTPVLLWGGTLRYRYFPARTAPPSADDRAAVYAVDDEKNLPAMIHAILDAHGGRPLSDAEIESYVWPEGVENLESVARSIVARGSLSRMIGARITPPDDSAASA